MEKEIIAGFIATYLARHGDDWDQVIGFDAFFEHMKEDKGLPEMFWNAIENPILGRNLPYAMQCLWEDGYTERVPAEPGSENQYRGFRVKHPLIDFYSDYIKRSAA